MKIQKIAEHDGFLITHVSYEGSTPDFSSSVVRLGYHPCSCGHSHPWAIGEAGFSIEHTKGLCETCKSYKNLVLENGKLQMDCSGCETCRLLACIH